MEKITEILLDIGLLRKSISEKWGPLAVGLGVDEASGNCLLCQYYHKGCFHDDNTCPILKHAGIGRCLSTPWQNWYHHWVNNHNDGSDGPMTVQCGECRTLVNRELMFLQRLLEKLKAELAEVGQ